VAHHSSVSHQREVVGCLLTAGSLSPGVAHHGRVDPQRFRFSHIRFGVVLLFIVLPRHRYIHSRDGHLRLVPSPVLLARRTRNFWTV